MRSWSAVVFAGVVSCCTMGGVAAIPASAHAVTTHATLDWNAPYRWVHVDNIAASRLAVFESARRRWLHELRQGDSLLADGRPLFWAHRSAAHSTLYTFYPFTRFGELDARRDAIRATEAAVAAGALADYDSADSVLVPPHYSQIWRRSADDDYVPEGGSNLTELTAGAGWLEVRAPAFFAGDAIDSAWTELRTILKFEHYPLVCRVYQNVYGSNDAMCLWLAPDAEMLRAAPSLTDVILRHFGALRAPGFWRRLNAVFPVTSTITLERRPELSNLGR